MALARAPVPMATSTLVYGKMERKTAWDACSLKMAKPSSLTAGEARSERLKKLLVGALAATLAIKRAIRKKTGKGR